MWQIVRSTLPTSQRAFTDPQPTTSPTQQQACAERSVSPSALADVGAHQLCEHSCMVQLHNCAGQVACSTTMQNGLYDVHCVQAGPSSC